MSPLTLLENVTDNVVTVCPHHFLISYSADSLLL